jgi:hypothetical protein
MPTAAKKATARGAPTDAVSHLADVTDRMHCFLMERRRIDGLRRG